MLALFPAFSFSAPSGGGLDSGFADPQRGGQGSQQNLGGCNCPGMALPSCWGLWESPLGSDIPYVLSMLEEPDRACCGWHPSVIVPRGQAGGSCQPCQLSLLAAGSFCVPQLWARPRDFEKAGIEVNAEPVFCLQLICGL